MKPKTKAESLARSNGYEFRHVYKQGPGAAKAARKATRKASNLAMRRSDRLRSVDQIQDLDGVPKPVRPMTAVMNARNALLCLGVPLLWLAHDVAHATALCAAPKISNVLASKAYLPELDLIDANSEMDILAAPHPRYGGYWVGVSHVASVGGHLLWYDCTSQRLTWVADTGEVQALRHIAAKGKWAAMVRVDGRYVGTGGEVVTSRWFPLNGKPHQLLLSVHTFERQTGEVERGTTRTVRFNRPPPQVEVATVDRVNGKVVARKTESLSAVQ
jgi:hypothetical protein